VPPEALLRLHTTDDTALVPGSAPTFVTAVMVHVRVVDGLDVECAEVNEHEPDAPVVHEAGVAASLHTPTTSAPLTAAPPPSTTDTLSVAFHASVAPTRTAEPDADPTATVTAIVVEVVVEVVVELVVEVVVELVVKVVVELVVPPPAVVVVVSPEDASCALQPSGEVGTVSPWEKVTPDVGAEWR